MTLIHGHSHGDHAHAQQYGASNRATETVVGRRLASQRFSRPFTLLQTKAGTSPDVRPTMDTDPDYFDPESEAHALFAAFARAAGLSVNREGKATYTHGTRLVSLVNGDLVIESPGVSESYSTDGGYDSIKINVSVPSGDGEIWSVTIYSDGSFAANQAGPNDAVAVHHRYIKAATEIAAAASRAARMIK